MTAKFAVRALDMPQNYADPGVAQVSVAKVLAQTNTISLFTVVGSIQASLVGVVSTVFGVATKPTLGITGSPTALAAAPAVAITAAVGTVLVLPQSLGAALPVPITATGVKASAYMFEVSNTAITLSCDTSTTGNVTWVLHWAPLATSMNSPGATVTTN